MPSHFFCPNCGHKPEFTEAFAEQVVEVICDFYGVTKKSIVWNVANTGIEGKVRNICMYFMRRMTGESFKIISDYFFYSNTKAGQCYANILNRVRNSKSYRSEVKALEVLLIEKINLVV